MQILHAQCDGQGRRPLRHVQIVPWQEEKRVKELSALLSRHFVLLTACAENCALARDSGGRRKPLANLLSASSVNDEDHQKKNLYRSRLTAFGYKLSEKS